MKEIRAFVRMSSVGRVVEVLAGNDNGLEFSLVEVRDIVHGLPPESYTYSVALGEPFEAMMRLEMVCRDEAVTAIVESIRKAAHTGRRGDGMIVIAPIEDVVRIDDNRRGDDALTRSPARRPVG